MYISELPAASQESAVIPGLKLTHVLRVVSATGGGALGKVSIELTRVDASVQKWTTIRCGSLLYHKIVIDNLSEACVSALRSELGKLEGVARVKVEHMYATSQR